MEDTHVAIFRNIFKESVKQEGLSQETIELINILIHSMVKAEIKWTNYITKNLLGFSEKTVIMFIQNQANSVTSNLGIPNLYEKTDGGPLMKLYEDYSLTKGAKSRTNFFEKANANYSIGTLDDDY